MVSIATVLLFAERAGGAAAERSGDRLPPPSYALEVLLTHVQSHPPEAVREAAMAFPPRRFRPFSTVPPGFHHTDNGHKAKSCRISRPVSSSPSDTVLDSTAIACAPIG